MTKDQIIKHFKINEKQKNLIEIFLEKISEENQKTNLVGKSTLEEPWIRHVCDSAQICKLIKNNQSSILDMGTGAGIPGVFLSILGYTNVVMVDSTKKKTDFVSRSIDSLGIRASVYNSRLEGLKITAFDFITARALAPIYKLINYSLFFSHKNTTLLFLKGRNVKKEIEEAKKLFAFNYELLNSKSSPDGFLIKIKSYKKKWQRLYL